MASLAEIRAKLLAQEQQSSGGQSQGDNAIFPFWNMAADSQSVIRFLPDGDENNVYFWQERLMIKLPFAGIKGDPTSKPVTVQVPCMEMYGESCPVLTEVRTWFKDPSLEDMGRKYWKKRSYLFQGFVRESGLAENSVPENPIRRFIIGPQIFKLIKSALLDPDMEVTPTDYQQGCNFRLVKTSKGDYADYSTSSWSRANTPLTEEEAITIDTHGLFNLSSFLPKKPSEVELKVIKEMFEASVDGEAYDEERWGEYYRPAGSSSRTGDPNSPSTPAARTTSTVPAVEPESAPEQESVDPEPTTSTTPVSSSKSNILEMIKARQQGN